jgi:hypothetical protein
MVSHMVGNHDPSGCPGSIPGVGVFRTWGLGLTTKLSKAMTNVNEQLACEVDSWCGRLVNLKNQNYSIISSLYRIMVLHRSRKGGDDLSPCSDWV